MIEIVKSWNLFILRLWRKFENFFASKMLPEIQEIPEVNKMLNAKSHFHSKVTRRLKISSFVMKFGRNDMPALMFVPRACLEWL